MIDADDRTVAVSICGFRGAAGRSVPVGCSGPRREGRSRVRVGSPSIFRSRARVSVRPGLTGSAAFATGPTAKVSNSWRANAPDRGSSFPKRGHGVAGKAGPSCDAESFARRGCCTVV